MHAPCLSLALFLAPTTGTFVPVPPPTTSSQEHESAIEAARAVVGSVWQENEIPGLCVAVWRGAELAWSEPFGVASLELGVPVTRASRFRLASVSKLLTAALTARLADDALVSLEADVREYLPRFPDTGVEISLRQLLGHQGGIRHYGAKDYDPGAPGGIIDARDYRDADAILALFATDPLVGEPGAQYHYSTFGYSLIGVVLESAMGEPFADLLQEMVLDPLEMHDTVSDDPRRIVDGRVGFYERIDDDSPPGQEPPDRIVNAPFVNASYKVPGGGMLSTAEDLARFGAAHFGPGFLSEAMYAEVFTPQTTSSGEETIVGLGWRIGEAGGRRIYHHSGSMNGARSVLVVMPEERVAVALLSNLGGRPEDVLSPGIAIAEAFLAAGPP